MDKLKKKILFVVVVFLIFLSFVSITGLAQNSSEIEKPDEEIESRIIQQAEEQKEAQLKDYFKKYYYEQGEDYFKKGQYPEAIAKFKRALHWDPQYEPAIKSIELVNAKIAEQQKLEEERRRAEEKRREAQEKAQQRKEKITEAKKASSKKISEEKVEKLTAPEVNLAQAESTQEPYRIDKDDIMEISVWRHPELLREVIVRPDGMISFPLAGDIKAAGLTPPELDEKVTAALSEFAQRRFKPSISEKADEKAEYLIGLGDTLDVSVWKIADLSREVIVRPDGMISFPLIGDLKAAGLTLVQLDEEVTKALSSYVKEPQVSIMVKSFGWKKEIPTEVLLEEKPEVTVMIKKFGGRKVIVLGEVIKPGVYSFTGDIRLIEAIGLAGDFTKYAVKNNILVLRGDISKSPQVIVSNIARLLKGADLGQNILVQSQDIIYVPRSLIGNINTFLEILQPAVNQYLQTLNARHLHDVVHAKGGI